MWEPSSNNGGKTKKKQIEHKKAVKSWRKEEWVKFCNFPTLEMRDDGWNMQFFIPILCVLCNRLRNLRKSSIYFLQFSFKIKTQCIYRYLIIQKS